MVWRDGISNHGIITVYTIRCPRYCSDLFGVTGNNLIIDACEGERYSRECGDQRAIVAGYCVKVAPSKQLKCNHQKSCSTL